MPPACSSVHRQRWQAAGHGGSWLLPGADTSAPPLMPIARSFANVQEQQSQPDLVPQEFMIEAEGVVLDPSILRFALMQR